MNAEELLKKYRDQGLEEADLANDPLDQVKLWMDVAATEGCAQPTAMALATANSSGVVGVRAVLCQSVGDLGPYFYTNNNSPKMLALAENAQCSALFSWLEIERQVRVTGIARPATSEESDSYWATRPRLSQVASSVSLQSDPLESREVFAERVADLEKQFEGHDIPRPEHWGGTLIEAQSIEFWQGRAARMHDRFIYSRTATVWTVQRLYP